MTLPTSPSVVTLVDIQDVLATTPVTLRALVAGAPAAALQFREADGAWTPTEVLAHVADGEITDWMPRLSVLLTDGCPRVFPSYDREGGFARYAGWDAHALVEEIARLRSGNLAHVRSLQITEESLRRTATHPVLGVVTLEQLLACWATHDLAHVAQISRVLVRYFGAHVGPWREFFSLLK